MSAPLPASLTLADVISAIGLTTEQMAKMSGVSRRQLSYWIQRGIVPECPEDARVMLERIMLVKTELESGSNLRQAVRRVERQVEERETLLADCSALGEHEVLEVLAIRLDIVDRLLSRLRDDAQHMSPSTLETLSRELDSINPAALFDVDADQPKADLLVELGNLICELQRLSTEVSSLVKPPLPIPS